LEKKNQKRFESNSRGSLRWDFPKEIREYSRKDREEFKRDGEGKIHGNLGPIPTLFEMRSTVSPRENLERI
jgi:hypothetical protein